MKILQKQTSRFVASLFNGLGIIACVSVSSCGSKGKNSKGNETDKFDGLKKKLKEANDNFGQLDSVPQNKIAQWFKDNPSQTNFSLTKDILQQIFVNDVNTLKSVAQTLGVDISDTDNEEKTDIQKWLDKLNELNWNDFNDLDNDDLKKKVAQKFIEKKIDINDNDAIIANLSSVISEIKNVEKTNNVTVKIENDGKASIVYSDNTNDFFEFKELSVLQNFVKALADKNVVGVKGEKWSLVLGNDKAKVCEHKDGFDYKNNFDEFLSCLNSLVKIQKLDFSGFNMTVDADGVSLGGNKLNEDFFKTSDFWNQVKNYPALFGLDFRKLQIAKKYLNVKINGFETGLKWSDVVASSTIKYGWNNIFKIKSVKAHAKPKPEVITPKKDGEENLKKDASQKEKVVFCLDNGEAKLIMQKNKTTTSKKIFLNSAQTINNFLYSLKDKNVGVFCQNFSITWGDTVTLCGIKLSCKGVDNFKALLKLLQFLKDNKTQVPQFKVSMQGAEVKVDGQKMCQDLVKKSNFWKSIKDDPNLFHLEFKLNITVTGRSKNIRIYVGNITMELNKENSIIISSNCNEFFDGTYNSDKKNYTLKKDWEDIFTHVK